MDSVQIAQRPTGNAKEHHIILERDGYAQSKKQPRCGQDRWNKGGGTIDVKDVDFVEFCELVANGNVCGRCLNYVDVTLS